MFRVFSKIKTQMKHKIITSVADSNIVKAGRVNFGCVLYVEKFITSFGKNFVEKFIISFVQ